MRTTRLLTIRGRCHVGGGVCTHPPPLSEGTHPLGTYPPCGQNDWQMPLKTLPSATSVVGGYYIQKQVCIPVRCIPPVCCLYLPACTVQGRGLSALGGVCFGGCLLPGGVLSQWGCLLPGGVCSGGVVCFCRGCVSQHALRQTPPPVNRMTDRRKNITFANFVCGR